MIPVVDVKYGRHLNKEETENLIQKAFKSKDTKVILNEFKELQINENTFVIEAAAKYEFVYPNRPNEVVFTETLVLKFDEKALINYHYIYTSKNSKEVTIGSIKQTIKDKVKLVNLNVFANNLEKTELEYDGQLEKDFSAQFSNENGYGEGKSLGEVYAQDWNDGCFPTYKHCGKNCGDKGKYGGGTPKNALDECCRMHDRCWEDFGPNDCQCDCDLIKCANKYNDNALLVLVINGFFPVKSSCKC